MLLADAPNVADWIAAIGQALGALFTAAAVAVALRIGRRERRWRSEDVERSEAERTDREFAQARLVTIEVDYEPFEWAMRSRIFWAGVHNASSDPVFEVELVGVTCSKRDDLTWQFDWGPLDSWETVPRVVLSGKKFGWPISYKDRRGQSVDGSGVDRVTLRFTDAAGLRWERTDNEPPRRVLDHFR